MGRGITGSVMTNDQRRETIRKTPCEPCLAEYMQGAECWNYRKEPDPNNPGGPWKIVGWFHCHRGIPDERPAA